MAWNEPGGNDNDPWGNRKNSGGPPDLDEVFKNLKKKIEGLLGGSSGQGGRGNDNGGGFGSGGSGDRGPNGSGGNGQGNGWGNRNTGSMLPGGLSPKLLGLAAAVLLAIWFVSGFYILQPAEQGVITQFGKYRKTVGSGLHWRVPWPVQKLEILDVEQIRSVQLRDQPVLTQDENIVDIDMAVQYKIKSAEDFLFKVRDPDSTLQEVVESAVREVIGQTDMEPVITTGRDAVGISTMQSVQGILDSYGTGIEVTAMNLERAQPPEEVQAAFSDAIKAREDKERFINEAQAYRNEVLPRARGDAQQIIEQSLAYRAQVEKAAEGESQRFSALLKEYEKAPEITRDRLYLDAMEAVLSNSSKVLMDSADGGNNLMYLPLDKLMNQQNNERALNPSGSPLPISPQPSVSETTRRIRESTRESLRSRSRESQ